MKVKIVNLSQNPLPEYKTPLSAGMDIHANLDAPLILTPLGRALVPTGLFIELPEGYEAQIRPRSGLAANLGVTVLNTPGTIDADYRGEIKLIMVNLSQEPATINPGERVAQMVVATHARVEWETVDTIESTKRGDGGFGHTGK